MNIELSYPGIRWPHTNDRGDSWTKVLHFHYCRLLGFGAPSAPGVYPTVFVWGNTRDGEALAYHCSDDQGVTWRRIAVYPGGLFDNPHRITGDPARPGRVYIGFSGHGYLYGDGSAQSLTK